MLFRHQEEKKMSLYAENIRCLEMQKRTRIKVWIRGDERFGPVSDLKTWNHDGRYSIEVQVQSLFQDQTVSSIRIANGIDICRRSHADPRGRECFTVTRCKSKTNFKTVINKRCELFQLDWDNGLTLKNRNPMVLVFSSVKIHHSFTATIKKFIEKIMEQSIMTKFLMNARKSHPTILNIGQTRWRKTSLMLRIGRLKNGYQFWQKAEDRRIRRHFGSSQHQFLLISLGTAPWRWVTLARWWQSALLVVPCCTSTTASWQVAMGRPSTMTSSVVPTLLRRLCRYNSLPATSLSDHFTRWEQQLAARQIQKASNSAKHVWTPNTAQDQSFSASPSSEDDLSTLTPVTQHVATPSSCCAAPALVIEYVAFALDVANTTPAHTGPCDTWASDTIHRARTRCSKHWFGEPEYFYRSCWGTNRCWKDDTEHRGIPCCTETSDTTRKFQECKLLGEPKSRLRSRLETFLFLKSWKTVEVMQIVHQEHLQRHTVNHEQIIAGRETAQYVVGFHPVPRQVKYKNFQMFKSLSGSRKRSFVKAPSRWRKLSHRNNCIYRPMSTTLISIHPFFKALSRRRI